MAGSQSQFCRQTSQVNSFFVLVWIRLDTSQINNHCSLQSNCDGSQECSGKERKAWKDSVTALFSEKLHLGRGKWFSTPCLLLKAEAMPLTIGDFRTLQRKFRIHLSGHSQRRGKLWFPSPFQALTLYFIFILFWIVMWIRNQISFLPLTWEWQLIV